MTGFTPIEKFLLLGALPAVIICSLIEAIVLSRRGGFDWRSMGVSLFDLFARTAVTILVPLSLAAPAVAWVTAHRLTSFDLSGWQAFALLFIGLEFCYYWYHRATHRIRWFWINHSIHHSPNELTLAAAYRIGMFGKLIGNTFFFLPLIWLGFDVRTVLAALSLNLLYQFWLHTTWIPKLGWVEYVLNTPSAHRVHHASNLEYLDANYGGVLIVFDRLFGTYIAERADLPCRYGWVKPLASYNPLKVEFGGWAALLRDLARVRSPRQLAGTLFGPPGWAGDGQGSTTEDLRAAARHGAPLADGAAHELPGVTAFTIRT